MVFGGGCKDQKLKKKTHYKPESLSRRNQTKNKKTLLQIDQLPAGVHGKTWRAPGVKIGKMMKGLLLQSKRPATFAKEKEELRRLLRDCPAL